MTHSTPNNLSQTKQTNPNIKDEAEWVALIRQQRAQGLLEESVHTCRQAIEQGISTAPIYAQLAHSLKMQGRKKSARRMYEKALQIDPQYVFAYRSYGAMLSGTVAHCQQAEQILRQGLALDPQDIGMWVSLGNSYSQMGRMAEAVSCYQRAQALNPKDPFPAAAELFAMNYQAQVSAQDIFVQAQKLGRLCSAQVQPYADWSLDLTQERPLRLKVGFVSPDLRNHPVGYFLENIMPHLCKQRYEWLAFSNLRTEDNTTRALKQSFDDWVDVSGMNHARMAQVIHQHGVHILIDLAGYTANGSIGALAYRPAPVQTNWLGWFATTGLPAMDFLLTDALSVQGIEAYFSEQLIELPRTRLCMMPPSHTLAVAPLPAQSNGFMTFGCVQNLAKLSDDWLKVWQQILHYAPSACLQIQSKQFSNPEQSTLFIKRAQQQGIAVERLKLRPAQNREQYLAGLSTVDILLDTHPYSGGTTTVEGLWMGVPTLTCTGQTMIARQGESLLTAAGLPDWVARSPSEYIDKAVAWSQRIEELAQLRQGLRAQVAVSPLFDGQQFARDFEGALECMWQLKRKNLQAKPLLTVS